MKHERLIGTVTLKKGRINICDFDDMGLDISVWTDGEKKEADVYCIYNDKAELKEILIKLGG